MLIRVEFRNRRYDLVQHYYLEALLASGRIRRFLRFDGWVETGTGPLRKGKDDLYTGPERRRHTGNRPLDQAICIDGRLYRPSFPAPPEETC